MPTQPQPTAAPHTPILDTIHSPADLKSLPPEKLPALAQEIRDTIIAVTSKNGGHVGPNLGVVELTIALHRVFNTPTDKFTFDVSHQSYPHKLLTGRNGQSFQQLRQTGGLSGFFNPSESPHDSFVAGHAGTALSAALGMAAARDQLGTDENIIALCGDASFTCGITSEALNNIGTSTKRLIIILNDNQWSIGKNVGAFARYFTRLSTSTTYNKLHQRIQNFFTSRPSGRHLHHLWTTWKRETKDFFIESGFFEKFGLRYIGPIDGHNIDELVKNLLFAKNAGFPVLLHVITQKGRGLQPAIDHPEKFHGANPYNPATGETIPPSKPTPPSYTEVFGNTLANLANNNPNLVAITAAMAAGTGLSTFAQKHPSKFYDVGIAEEHAVLFAAGISTKKNLHPVVAIYSTFLQRAHDQIIHDIALQNLPVTFCLDRAGLSPADGPTHHGLFDIAIIRPVPNTTIMQPANEDEFADMLLTATEHPAPTFIRYPRGAAEGVTIKPTPEKIPLGKAQLLQQGATVAIWALGNMNSHARQLFQLLSAHNITPTLVNARFVKPLDSALLEQHAQTHNLILTLEDHSLTGGFGSAVLEHLQNKNLTTPVLRIGWPDTFIPHATTTDALRQQHHLTPQDTLKKLLDHPAISQKLPNKSQTEAPPAPDSAAAPPPPTS